MMSEFNQTIEYIESVLDTEIDEKKIEKYSGYSYPMFSRLFSIITNFTLSEYIRLRKLTSSAIELRESKEKIIDIAFKYGYESSDSFAFAFKRFHQYTPSEVRNGAIFKVFSPLKLSLTVHGGTDMDIKIERKKGFRIAGIKSENIDASQISQTWDLLFSNNSLEKLKMLGSGKCFGACCENSKMNNIHYMAGYDVKNIIKAKNLGFDVLEVKDAEYAVIKLKGAVAKCIQEGWKYVMEVFFPEQGYKHAGTPDFEYYFEGDLYSDDYEMELWVPIIKTK